MRKDFLIRTIHQSYFLVAFTIGIIAGTILSLVFRINFFASPVWLILAIALLILTYFRPKLIFITLALLSGLLVSFFRVATELSGENYIKTFYDQTVTITGTVDGDPTTNGNIKIKLKNLHFVTENTTTSGTIYISLKSNATNAEISRSDVITIKGKLSPGFGTYAGYLYQPEVLEIKRPEPGDLILRIRNDFAARIKYKVPDQESALGLSYLLGMKTNLDRELDENLRLVGLVHIVVASGTHLSILVSVARKIFGKLSRFAGVLFAIVFILFFMSLVGFTPSILRAGLMSIFTLVAWYFGHSFAPWRIIILVAALTLLINPMFLIDLGWLLSFASFIGIMILGPRLTKFFYGDKHPSFIASTIITTISATLVTLPITLYYFGQVSLISVLANLIILPTLPFALGLTFATGLVANIPLLNTATSFLVTKLLDFHIFIVDFFANQISFLIKTSPYQTWFFALYIIVFTPLIIGLIRDKMVKLKQQKI